DYINYYMDEAVDFIRQEQGIDQINMMGICMGGTMGLIYTALHPEKIKNLATFAAPVQTDIDDGILFLWARKVDVDKVLQALGNLPGQLSNLLYMLAVPVGSVDKYIQFFEKSNDPEFISTFLRMEKWSFDTPDMPGEVFRQYIKDIFQDNLLIQNKMEIEGQRIDLKNVTCPVLNVYGTKDYIVPPSSARPLSKAVASKDVTDHEINTGHISMFMGKRSSLEVTPKVVEWIKAR
ncbi:MAG: alpha/beta fold hydrolase, partial [Desulfobacteraceae bacterium]|nr:alpha/beta fold hydrolase [Desulfobacteraceae bacterium]